MPRTPLQFKKMRESRKLSIDQAALGLFAIYGEKNTSVDLIARKAKCSHGLVYHYYSNVPAIFESLTHKKEYLAIKEKLCRSPKGEYSISLIENIVNEMLLAASRDSNTICLYILILNEEGKNGLMNRLQSLVRQGQKEGDVVGGDPKEIVETFASLMSGLYYPQIQERKTKVKIPSADVVLRIFKKRA